MSRFAWFIIGIAFGLVILAPLGGYLFAKLGGIAMATTANPLPFEETIAKTALHASLGDAAKIQDPLPDEEANLMGGVHIYQENCGMCHGLPEHPKTAIAQGEFPPPPQLFEPKQMVTDDPQGVTYWKVSHGIRLSGMPGFAKTLSDNERWQVTMLLARADKLPPTVRATLTNVPACSDSAKPGYSADRAR